MEVLDFQVEYDTDGKLDHIALHLVEGGRTRWRAVCMATLKRLPRSNRESTSLIQRTRKALKAAYGAGVDLAVLYAGIPGRGVVQIYAAVAEDTARDRAVERARNSLSLVLGMLMAAFPQSRFEPPDFDVVEFIRRAFRENPYTLAFVGQPDPREGVRAPLRDRPDGTPTSPRPEELGLQQNEYVFRGMMALGKPFLTLFLFHRVGNGDPKALFRLKERVRAEAGLWRSRTTGTKGWSIGLSLPVILTGLDTTGTGVAHGASRADAHQEGRAHTVAEAETTGTADTRNWSRAVTEGESWSRVVTHGVAHTTGEAHTTTRATTTGTSESTFRAVSDGTAHTVAVGTTTGESHTTVRSENWSTASTTGSTWGASTANASGWNVSGDVGVGLFGIVDAGASAGRTWGTTVTSTSGGMSSTTSAHGWGVSEATGHFTATTHTTADTTSHVETRGTGTATMQATTTGEAHTTMQATTVSDSISLGHARSRAVTEAEGGAHTEMHSRTTGTADTTSTAVGHAVGVVQAQAVNAARAVGLGLGIAPSLSWNRSYQAVDYVADMVARALEDQMRLLDQAAMEGAFFVDAYALLPDAAAREAMKGLFVQAFHGEEGVATPVQPVDLSPEEEERIRTYALAFSPAPDPEPSPFALEGYRFTTLVTLTQAAAYAAPGAYEEGEADTVAEEIPPFAFPRFDTGLLLGHLFSTERGELTDAPVRLPRERMANFAAVADTRFGKSVVCERLVLEAVREWHWRAVVLDFGLGWRKLVRVLDPDRVEVWGLSPQSPRPIRWNPLQIGRRILPEAQLEVTCELFANAGRMGPRQLGFLRQTLRDLYVEHGVLVNDREVLEHPRWGRVQPEEARRLGLPAGMSLYDLPPEVLQRLAVERSKAVDITLWYERLRALQSRFSPRDPSYASLEGVLLRLAPFTQGRLARMYGRGEGSMPIEDLALPWGLAVLEGGLLQGMEYVKAVLLGLIAWHLYTDAVVRKQTGEPGADTPMILLFEEGNKVLTAGAAVVGGDEGGPPQTAEIFQSMFRDAGKYNIYLGVIAQSPSELPPGILSSCNVLFVGQLKNPDDVRVAIAALGRTHAGFVDTPYLRFVENMPRAMFIGKFGLGWRREEVEPFLFRPLMVEADMPTDEEIRRMYGGNDPTRNP